MKCITSTSTTGPHRLGEPHHPTRTLLAGAAILAIGGCEGSIRAVRPPGRRPAGDVQRWLRRDPREAAGGAGGAVTPSKHGQRGSGCSSIGDPSSRSPSSLRRNAASVVTRKFLAHDGFLDDVFGAFAPDIGPTAGTGGEGHPRGAQHKEGRTQKPPSAPAAPTPWVAAGGRAMRDSEKRFWCDMQVLSSVDSHRGAMSFPYTGATNHRRST